MSLTFIININKWKILIKNRSDMWSMSFSQRLSTKFRLCIYRSFLKNDFFLSMFVRSAWTLKASYYHFFLSSLLFFG
jgi:hypothetical protein